MVLSRDLSKVTKGTGDGRWDVLTGSAGGGLGSREVQETAQSLFSQFVQVYLYISLEP